MDKINEYYNIEVQLSNGENIKKNNVKVATGDDAWETAYDGEDNEVITILDNKGTYHILTKSHIVQVIVRKTNY